MALDVLVGERLLERRTGTYEVGPAGRRWLDPSSPTYLGTYIQHTMEYWKWWGEIEAVLRGGPPITLHRAPRMTRAGRLHPWQYELARLSVSAVARSIPLRGDPMSVLDLGGGHGLFAARCAGAIGDCDGPRPSRIGRRGTTIAGEAGFTDVVDFVEGDIFTSDLGGPDDAVLCCSILHHFAPDEIDALLTRARAAFPPGGVLAVLDLFHAEDQPTASAAIFELFFNLTSGMDTLTEERLTAALTASGFSGPRGAPCEPSPTFASTRHRLSDLRGRRPRADRAPGGCAVRSPASIRDGLRTKQSPTPGGRAPGPAALRPREPDHDVGAQRRDQAVEPVGQPPVGVPRSSITEGTMTMRTRVASISTATARPGRTP